MRIGCRRSRAPVEDAVAPASTRDWGILARVGAGVPVFLYHGRNDEVVPFARVELYAAAVPQAKVRRLDGRNHQLNDDLSEVARDIESV